MFSILFSDSVGLVLNGLALLSLGYCNVLIPQTRDVKSVVKVFRDHEPSVLVGSGAFLDSLIADLGF